MSLERFSPEQRRGCFRSQQALENRRSFLFAFQTVDFSLEHFTWNSRREFYTCQLVSEIRLVGGSQCLDQDLKVFALLRRRRVTNGCAKHLPDAEPIAVKVIGESPEGSLPAAKQPAEDNATADVQAAPPPVFNRAKLLPAFFGKQSHRYLFGDESVEYPIGECHLIFTTRGL